MKTKDGHEITNFKRLDPPIIRYERSMHIYGGEIINDYTNKPQDLTWDSSGKVINRNVPQYDIDILEAERYLTNP